MTTRTTLRRDLADLKQKVYTLGERILEISDIYNSLLESYTTSLEKRLIDITNETKAESKGLHEQCFLVLTLQQPLIKDLRFVIGSLQIVLNLEKICEQYYSTLPQVSSIPTLDIKLKSDFVKMGRGAGEMLRNSLTLYLSSNISAIQEVKKSFAEVNYLHDLLYKQILNEVASASGQKAQVEAQLLSTVRSIEKIADSILNIVDQVNYIIIGQQTAEKDS
ncbi:MAG: phosphate uptake regulator PhoU [Candidatus Melainabacteria bacterium]|nr:phosphate uptake regulator PhoU [Candidatus Melainabacteria bacterium]MBI3308601.1 phosphate uptake regulator PhoU [Candidatus Melainabacteria bacterium]